MTAPDSTPLPFSVNLWGSRPGTADDCWTGGDFATLEEAEAAFVDPSTMSSYIAKSIAGAVRDGSELWIEMTGPQLQKERCLCRGRKNRKADRDDQRREMAMEAGMAFGCDAYNDMMGW